MCICVCVRGRTLMCVYVCVRSLLTSHILVYRAKNRLPTREFSTVTGEHICERVQPQDSVLQVSGSEMPFYRLCQSQPHILSISNPPASHLAHFQSCLHEACLDPEIRGSALKKTEQLSLCLPPLPGLPFLPCIPVMLPYSASFPQTQH